MKKYIFILFAAISLSASAQYPVIEFKDTIQTWINSDTLSNIPLLRKATYECLIDNRRTNTVSIQVRVDYFTKDSTPFTLIPAKSVELIADQNGYVRADPGHEGDFLGTISEVQQAYGTYDSIGQAWSYALPVMRESDFYHQVATMPVGMRALIMQAILSSTKLKQR